MLIVEDDMVTAGGLGPAITDAGHDLVGLAADRDTAVALLGSTDIDLALVDLRLLDGWTGLDVARAAERHGVAVVFATATPGGIPPSPHATGVIEKPFRAQAVKSVLDYMDARLSGSPPRARPRCLKPLAAPAARNASSATDVASCDA